jgi:hypothetical protein
VIYLADHKHRESLADADGDLPGDAGSIAL